MFTGLRLNRLSKPMASMLTAFKHRPVLSQLQIMRYFGSIIHVKLPDLGEGTKEATLKEWFVEKGSEINEYQDIWEVFTDKLVAQIPSTHKGIIKELYFQADDVCPVGSTLADIEILEEGEVPSQAPKKDAKAHKVEEDAAHTPMTSTSKSSLNKVHTEGEKALATPVTRNYAKSLGVDISQVNGTGKDGRVTNQDVDTFLAAPKHAVSKSVSESKKEVKAPVVSQPQLKGIGGKDLIKKITAIKKGMTKTMTESLNIPFFTYQDEYNCTKLMSLRKELKANHHNLTLLPFFIKAISLALRNHPGMNINVNPDLDKDGYIHEYVIKHDHNIAIAVDSPLGLVVPIIHQVQNKSIIEINQECVELREKASTGKLTAQDYEGGTFSVSSVGNLGGTTFVPTILRPQGAIVAIGKAKKKAHYVETNKDGHVFVPIDSIWFSFSCDHRVIDGATCARFSEDIRKLIENPQNMLLNMN